jgi:hypothetical protein
MLKSGYKIISKRKMYFLVMKFSPEMQSLIDELSKAEWHRSTQGNSHEYIIRNKYPELYDKLQELIKRHGIYGKHKKWTYRYYFCEDGMKYWIIPPVLNRARADTGQL